MDTHLHLACKPKSSIDFYKVLSMAVLFDQYTVSGLTNCLVDFKHCNKNVSRHSVMSYKGLYIKAVMGFSAASQLFQRVLK